MDARHLLVEFERRGVEVRTDGGQLRYRPQGAVTAELRAAMAARRDELLTLVDREEQHVRWRVDAMAAQVPSSGSIPFLVARPLVAASDESCASCCDALPPDACHRC